MRKRDAKNQALIMLHGLKEKLVAEICRVELRRLQVTGQPDGVGEGAGALDQMVQSSLFSFRAGPQDAQSMGTRVATQPRLSWSQLSCQT